MDSSILHLLEEDEDDTMHTSAEVEAYAAALNQDINTATSTFQPPGSITHVSSQGSGYTSNQPQPQWNPSTHMEHAGSTMPQIQTERLSSERGLQQKGVVIHSQKALNDVSLVLRPFAPVEKPFLVDSCQIQSQQNAPHTSQMAAMHDSGNVPVHNSADHESQHMKLQNMNSQPAVNQQIPTTAEGMSNKQPIHPWASSQQELVSGNINRLASDPFRYKKDEAPGALLSMMLPQVDKDKARQLEAIYDRLQRKEISRHDFLMQLKCFVGDQTLRMAIHKLQSQIKNEQNTPQFSAHSQAEAQQRQSSTVSDGITNAVKPRDIERVPGAQTAIFARGSPASNHPPVLRQNASASASPLKLGPHDSQRRRILANQNTSATSPLGMTSQGLNIANMPKFDSPNFINDPKKRPSSSPHMTNSSPLPQNTVQWQSSSSNGQKSGTSSSMPYEKQENLIPRNSKDEMHHSIAGFSKSASTDTICTSTIYSQAETTNLLNSRKTPAAPLVDPAKNAKSSSKKPKAGQKKPLEVLGSSPPPSSKKQKVSEALMDQSVEQLLDVTAVGGVDLQEEDKLLFSISREDSRVLEASRKVVQEEEERLILEKVPLQIKLAEIVSKSGLKGIGNNVERCLSLCVEERFRELIGNLIKMSKNRLDNEKLQHKTIVSSDVGQQIMLLNRKARAEWESKLAEAEKLQKMNEDTGRNLEADDEKDKDEGHSRMSKANKEVEDTMRTTAANVAARAAIGGDDMLSKWKLMAEARQNRLGDSASTFPPERELPSSISVTKYNQQVDKKVQSSGVAKKVGKSSAAVRHRPKAVGSISVRDVIAVLEREPQMSRSSLIYRLYEKIQSKNDKFE